ncbi:acyl carrier protein [Paracoccus sphaerophysae]|uniref:acyl carrier protein n=1 Tax=Paracoccus sphaerophysae TaxID=690417 RepID=UPI002352DD62|nr:acyl carrier protein [Paracoccus sphaerophysae]
MSFRDDLIAFIGEDAGIDRAEIGDDTLLFSEGFIDSFTMSSVLAFIEEQKGIQIEMSDVTLENFDSVSRIIAFVDRQSARG